MIKEIVKRLCFKYQWFAEWLLDRDINRITKAIYKSHKDASPSCNIQQARKIALELMWNQPEKVISALENIRY